MSIIRKSESPEQVAAREAEIAAFKRSVRCPIEVREMAKRVQLSDTERAWLVQQTGDMNLMADALLATKVLRDAEGENVDLRAAHEEAKGLRNDLEAARRQLREAQLAIDATGRESDRAKVLATGAQAISSGD